MSKEEIQVSQGAVYGVSFEEPYAGADGYVRPFLADAHIKGQTTERHSGRLRFTFRGDRDNRHFMVLSECHGIDGQSWETERLFRTDNSAEALDLMRGNVDAARLALSGYFASDDPEHGFPSPN